MLMAVYIEAWVALLFKEDRPNPYKKYILTLIVAYASTFQRCEFIYSI